MSVTILNKKHDSIPSGAVYVGRPSPYGNPFTIGKDGNRSQVIAKFWIYALERLECEPHWLDALRGVPFLVCWCSPEDCHAEVVGILANR